jgi:non-ribosomal peptide synthetase component F
MWAPGIFTYAQSSQTLRVSPATYPIPCRSFRNVYGPTETTIWSTCELFKDEPTGHVSIGSPIAQTQLYVLDENRRQCKAGQSGESNGHILHYPRS